MLKRFFAFFQWLVSDRPPPLSEEAIHAADIERFDLEDPGWDKRGCADPDFTGFENCTTVACPCGKCKGILHSDGRNTMNNLTFLMCDKCGCMYVAEDFNKKENHDPPQG